MELGKKLRQARLEAGLSQRVVCGDVITRNMLSQIENGSAKPSMATLQYLANRLGKPMSYFLEEQIVLSPNPQVIARAREAYAGRQYEQVLQILVGYREPDPLFDPEKHYLAALCALAQAEAIGPREPRQAEMLLERINRDSVYYTEAMEKKRRMLLYMAWQALEEEAREREDYQRAYFYACKLRNA